MSLMNRDSVEAKRVASRAQLNRARFITGFALVLVCCGRTTQPSNRAPSADASGDGGASGIEAAPGSGTSPSEAGAGGDNGETPGNETMSGGALSEPRSCALRALIDT